MPQAQLAWVRSSTSHELRTEKPPSSIQNAMACGCGGTPQARAARMLPRQALEPHYLGAVNELLRLGFPGGPAGGGLGDRLGRLEPFGADRFSRGVWRGHGGGPVALTDGALGVAVGLGGRPEAGLAGSGHVLGDGGAVHDLLDQRTALN